MSALLYSPACHSYTRAGKPSTFAKQGFSESESISLMRFFHYLPLDAFKAMQDRENKRKSIRANEGAPEEILHSGTRTPIGSSPHTDWGFLTVILQDMTGSNRRQ